MSDRAPGGMSDVMARVWAKSQPIIDERVGVLREVAAQLPDVGPDRRAEAYDAAHKLAGSLGTFGLVKASELASALEQELDPANLNADIAKVPELVEALANELP